MNLLIAAATTGLILALLGLGVFISYRIYATLDLTADGSFGVGVAVVAALLVRGTPPLAATAMGTLAGVAAGSVTGILHTQFRVSALLAGVLTSTALYSVSLFVMGSGNLSLASADSLLTMAERVGQHVFGLPATLTLLGTDVSGGSVATLVLMALLAGGLAVILALFMGTDLGLAMRAAGNESADGQGGRHRCRSHGHSRPRALERTHCIRRGALRTVPGLRGHPDGHRRAGDGPRESHGRRGVAGAPTRWGDGSPERSWARWSFA